MPSRSVLALWHAVLAAASTAVAGTTLGEFVGQRTAGLLALGVAALQSGTAAFHVARIQTVHGKEPPA